MYFFFNDTATTEIYTLSLHDALPIYEEWRVGGLDHGWRFEGFDACLCFEAGQHGPNGEEGLIVRRKAASTLKVRSEEHTSELQSRQYLVCRLLLETKNTSITLFLSTR